MKEMNDTYSNEMVSVIIPAYNLQEYIEETIFRVLRQTYRNLEIIVVDDCSTDRTGEIVENLVEKEKRLKYIKLKSNSGAAVARNTAIEEAKGRYIAFLDGDDLWTENKIEKQISLLKLKNGAFCYSAIEMIDCEGNLIRQKNRIIPEVNYKILLRNTIIATSTVLVDRKIIGNFQMPLRRSGQDYATWLMLLRNGTVAYGIDEALVQYRLGRNGSLSETKSKNYKKVWHVQVEDEGISKTAATLNSFFYLINAVKKYGLSYSTEIIVKPRKKILPGGVSRVANSCLSLFTDESIWKCYCTSSMNYVGGA